MRTAPAATLRPFSRLAAVPADFTVTPWPMLNVPLVTEMPCPPVFWTVTYDRLALLPSPGATPSAMPDVCDEPSIVMGAAGSGVRPARSPASWKPATLDSVGSGLAGSVSETGPALVVMVTLAGTRMGSVSLAARGVVWPAWPSTMICVPGAAKPPATASALETVLKLQFGFAIEPMTPLPVALASLPLIGSTKYLLP